MTKTCEIEYDLVKQQKTLEERNLDFNDAPQIFAGRTFDTVDDRQDYGEERVFTAGKLLDRIVVIVWTQRDNKRRIISMRYANERERQQYGKHLD